MLTGVLFQVLKTSLKLFDRTYALSESDNATTLNLTQENIPGEKQKHVQKRSGRKVRLFGRIYLGKNRFEDLPFCLAAGFACAKS